MTYEIVAGGNGRGSPRENKFSDPSLSVDRDNPERPVRRPKSKINNTVPKRWPFSETERDRKDQQPANFAENRQKYGKAEPGDRNRCAG